ncbi:Stromelysin-2 [Dactylellina cionopaga]|nr:Stromelysin-2 [Dactylellina cionopaga]
MPRAQVCSCGTRSPHPALARRQTAGFFYNATSRWPSGFAFKWQLTGTIRGFDMETMTAAVARGFEKWQGVTNFTFTQAQGQDYNLDISVSGPDMTDDQFPSHAEGGYTLAVGFMGPLGDLNQPYGSLRFNDTATGTPNWNVPSIHNVFVHEFGHVLGLGHTQDASAVMAPFLANMTDEYQLTSVDVSNFQAFYSDPNIPSGQTQQSQTQQSYNQNDNQNYNQNYNQNDNQNYNTGTIKRDIARRWMQHAQYNRRRRALLPPPPPPPPPPGATRARVYRR